VASIDEEVKQVRYGALLDLLRLHLDKSRALLAGEFAGLTPLELTRETKKFAEGQLDFLSALAQTAGLPPGGTQQPAVLLTELEYLEKVSQSAGSLLAGETAKLLVFVWLVLHRCGELTAAVDPAKAGSELVGNFGLARPLEEELCGEATDSGDQLAQFDVSAVMALFAVVLRWQRFMGFTGVAQAELLPNLFADRDVARFIGLHRSGGYQWFICERWELLLEWLELVALTAAAGDGSLAKAAGAATARQYLLKAAATAGYRLDRLLKDLTC
jgi:hypothetical protein